MSLIIEAAMALALYAVFIWAAPQVANRVVLLLARRMGRQQ